MEQTTLPLVIMLWALAITCVGGCISLLYSLFILLFLKTKDIKSLEVLNKQSRIREMELEKLKNDLGIKYPERTFRMRSVIVHMRGPDEATISGFLSAFCPTNGTDQWLLRVGSDPVLFIRIYRDLEHEAEPDDLHHLMRLLKGRPTVSLSIGVSGRHPGDAEVRAFVTRVLESFTAGVVEDDFSSPHYWSLKEIQEGTSVNGFKFFDYRATSERQSPA